MVLIGPTSRIGEPGSFVAVRFPPSVTFSAPRLTGEPGVWRSRALTTRSFGIVSVRFIRIASNGLDGGGAGVAWAMTAVVLPLSGWMAFVEYGDEPSIATIWSMLISPVVRPRKPWMIGERSCPDSDIAVSSRTLPILL